jgi:inhibitor of KinA sporulation pathway (predicted exonuclease)
MASRPSRVGGQGRKNRYNGASAPETHTVKARRLVRSIVKRPPQPAFDFYLVLDFEATCCEAESPGARPEFGKPEMEVIEFPSVLLDARPMRAGKAPLLISEYQAYVKPRIHPTLTAFCTGLTGIAQETVDGAGSFAQAYKGHMKWLQGLGFSLHTVQESMCIVTCGDWDLKTMLPRQLQHEARLDGRRYQLPALYGRWINLQVPFRDLYGARGGMKRMLDLLEIPLTGRHHSGIDDCRNTCKVLVRLLRDGSPVPVTGSHAQRFKAPKQGRGQARAQPTTAAALQSPAAGAPAKSVDVMRLCRFDGDCHVANPKHWKRYDHVQQRAALPWPDQGAEKTTETTETTTTTTTTTT